METTEFGDVGEENLTTTNPTLQISTGDDSRCDYYAGYPIEVVVVSGFATFFVTFFGLVGNTLSLAVLSRPTMRSTSTNVFLIALSLCDLVFVIFSSLFFALPMLLHYFCVWDYYLKVIFPVIISDLYGLYCLALAGSIYFTVGVTIERFVVVYRPLSARVLCTVKNAYWASLAIFAFVILYTLPTWWEYKYKDEFDENGNWSGYGVELAPYAEDLSSPYSVYYVGWSTIFVYRLIPIAALIVLNLLIYRKIRSATQRRNTMTASTSTLAANENSITRMLLWVVTVFIVCNSVKLYTSLRTTIGLEKAWLTTKVIGGLLVNINSAINFVVYCLVGHKFRRTFAGIFCCSRAKSLSRPPTRTTTTVSNVNISSSNSSLSTAATTGKGTATPGPAVVLKLQNVQQMKEENESQPAP